MADDREMIDRLRGPDGGLDGEALRRVLPYGDDFLFVDRVARLEADEIEASFRVPDDAPYLRSHFVDLPLMPGVLIAEGIGQAASLIVRYNLTSREQQDVLGLEVHRARFSAPVLPGDTIVYRVHRTSMNRRAARCEGSASVEDTTVCRAKLTVAIVSRRLLRKQLETRTQP